VYLIYDQLVAAMGDPFRGVPQPKLTAAQRKRSDRKVLRWQQAAIKEANK
jgi:hypothetical protein